MQNLLLLIFFYAVSCYNIIFLPGSFIKPVFYKKLLDKVQNNLQEKEINITYKIGNYFDIVNKKPNTTIIGHSFGSYFGLLKCLEDNTGNIKNCILINGHFNQRYKMPYPGIKLSNIKQNVLVILTQHDEKLPIKKAMDDIDVRNTENLHNIDFIVNNGTHLSSFAEDVNIVASQISTYIKNKIT